MNSKSIETRLIRSSSFSERDFFRCFNKLGAIQCVSEVKDTGAAVDRSVGRTASCTELRMSSNSSGL